ncbi:rhamnulokinase [Clostridium sp. D2Q-14]|uniref:rhamnulokinase n=1 Tax=Anaeromonas gelatinilytica TaxID=2683194 RepID=UPI00193C27CC|nr:rhamnulokinase family protein [Anaeromonas gelatinilytica]MBS4535014.1 rhamnulokinase [Anaeromonas gelatinilytica]
MEIENNEKKVLAIDLGGSSGRAMLGTFNGNIINIHEIHRFSNDPVMMNEIMYWDVLRLFYEIKQSLVKAKQYGKIDSIAIDTWGVDFGLLDEHGNLLENPIHYRDKRTKGMIEKSFQKISKKDFYSITGNQFMEINTAFQLLSLKENRREFLNRARTMLLMPDLFNYLLSGVKVTESTIASTTQLFDAKKKYWSKEVINSLGLPEKIFTDIVTGGTVIGEISKDLCEELDIASSKVVAVAGHDTQSALVATPTVEDDFIFLSCGTWSLLGTELDKPIINEKSLKLNITNEDAYKEKSSFLKNIIGLWLIQESRRQWIREGKEFSFAALEKMAECAKPFRCFIDPDDPMFIPAGNIPKRIQEFCRKTGQPVPKTEAEIIRCIDESLALKYRSSLDEIKLCTEKNYKTIYMIGGGIQSQLLCSMTASACNLEVSAGPIEATVLGNVCLQFMAMGDIKDIKQARAIIKKSHDITVYNPKNVDMWNEAYKRFKEVVKC